jgi:hypothetical protein
MWARVARVMNPPTHRVSASSPDPAALNVKICKPEEAALGELKTDPTPFMVAVNARVYMPTRMLHLVIAFPIRSETAVRQ